MPDPEKEAQDLLIADEHIAAGQKRLSEHTRLVKVLPAGSRERAAAETLLAILQKSVKQWKHHREQILHLIDPAQYPAVAMEVIAVVAVPLDEVQRRLLPDVRRWRLKAGELREVASRVQDPVAGQTFLRLSQDYELLAERTEKRLTRERKAKAPSPAARTR